MAFLLPDLAGFTAAALLLLLALAIGLLATLIGNTLGHAPVIGGWVKRDLVGWMRDAADAVLRSADATWHFAAGLFNWASDAFTKGLLAVAGWAEWAWSWLTTIRDHLIPEALSWATREALNAYRSAVSEARTLYDTAERDLARDVTAVETRATSLYDDAVLHADQLFSAAERALQAGITSAELAAAHELSVVSSALSAGISAAEQTARFDLEQLAASANGAISSLAGDVLREVGAAEALAAAQLAAVRSGIYTDLDTWGNEAVTVAWPDAAGDLAALRRVLGGDFPWLNDLTGLLAGAGSAGLLGALIRSMATSQALTRLAADCTVPTCRNLSGFGNDLANLLGDVSAAALLAWIIFMVTDPAGWAADTYLAGGPVITDTLAKAASLFGAG